MDRFAEKTTPILPVEVGSCSGCSGVMYGYEVVICQLCCESVHTGCKVECSICGAEGCKACMVQDQDKLEWHCQEDCSDG